jgi:hypothetical protein
MSLTTMGGFFSFFVESAMTFKKIKQMLLNKNSVLGTLIIFSQTTYYHR